MLKYCNKNDAAIKDNRKCFLPKSEIKNYNVLIDKRHFYDQQVNDPIKQYDKVRNIAIRQGDEENYTMLIRLCLS